jgi:hypothetical protein
MPGEKRSRANGQSADRCQRCTDANGLFVQLVTVVLGKLHRRRCRFFWVSQAAHRRRRYGNGEMDRLS